MLKGTIPKTPRAEIIDRITAILRSQMDVIRECVAELENDRIDEETLAGRIQELEETASLSNPPAPSLIR